MADYLCKSPPAVLPGFFTRFSLSYFMKQTATFLLARPAWARLLLLLALALSLPARPAFAAPRPPRRLPVGGQLAGGYDHSLLLRPNGALYAWGDNTQGQLGNGGNTNSLVPVAVGQGAVPAGVRLVQVAAGYEYSLALGSNGLVYAWGSNDNGQLGDGSTTARSSPVAVSLPAGVRIVQVAAGLFHSLALAADGTAYAWGYNYSGQLGNNSTTDSPTPVAVGLGAMPTGTKLVQVAAGNRHSLALAADGTAYAWGSNGFGQLGNGGTGSTLVPAAVTMPTGVRFVQVTTGQNHSLALAADGTAYAWGGNGNGQLGNNSTTDSSTPVAVSLGAMPAGTKLVQLAGGDSHSLALAADGTAYAWGYNGYGELGNSTNTKSSTPVAVSPGAMPAGTRLAQLASGSLADHSLALAADGTLYAWGFNADGELGNNSTDNSPVPVVPQLPDQALGYQQAAAGNSHSLGLRADGTAYAWGWNYSGQLGNNSTTDSYAPVAVSLGALPTGTRLVQVAAGGYHSLALAADGTAYAWGYNYFGQLGNNSTTDSHAPVAVSLGAIPSGTKLVQIAGGASYNLALAADGTAYAWGSNNFGQLGNNSTTDSHTPVAVSLGALPTGTRLVQLAGGGSHSLALAADGTAYAWGRNNFGQLGNNSTTDSSTPVAVSLGAMPAGTKLVQVAVGDSHSLALAADGTVYAWGYNQYGQLGNNSTTNSSTPVAVTMPAGVRFVQLAGGGSHSLALAADGRLFAWGYNTYGQLGTGTKTNSLVPVAEASGTVAWTALAAGPTANHSLVLGQQAAVYTAGNNSNGQLGDGTTTNSPLFIRNLAPLPVQLVSFTAQAAGPAAVRLAWATASEVNSAYFAIERSLDGTTWQELGRVAAAGSSASPRQYAYPDQAAPAGVLYYRLRQVDQDGTAAYSPVQTLTLGAGGLALYPNPARGGAATFSGIAPGAAVRVLDALGRVTATATADATGTAHLTGLAPGLYVVQAGVSSLHLAVE